MRLVILLIVLLGVAGCEKTIKEVKAPVGVTERCKTFPAA